MPVSSNPKKMYFVALSGLITGFNHSRNTEQTYSPTGILAGKNPNYA
jgi:hypothetical protein